QGRAPRTAALRVTAIAGYWSWLQRRGHLPDDQRNPWAGQAPRRQKTARGGLNEERAFNDPEVALLLFSAPTVVLSDFMLTASLTGLRREEIGQMRVADCAGGVLIVREGKTPAATRRVPVHSALASLVHRRTAGKGPQDYLFGDLPGGADGSRTGAIG